MAKATLDGVALIVGGGGGLGTESAFSLAESGARAIVLADIKEDAAKEAAEASKKYATNPAYSTATIFVDVRDEKSVQAMVDFTVKTYGRLDYAINGAGIDNGTYAPFADSVISDFDNVMKVNARGFMLRIKAETKAMLAQDTRKIQGRTAERDIGRGVIVNMASANSYCGLPGKMAYTTSKHAVMGMTKMAAIDYGGHGIRVNAVCPTWVHTPLQDEENRKNPAIPAMVEKVVPNKRMAQPEEISDIIAFLCSPSCSYVTGTGLMIDAGITLTLHVT